MKCDTALAFAKRRALTTTCALALAIGGCSSGPPARGEAPPPEVSVLRVRAAPVTIYDDYVARAAAPETIEVRSQVTGTLDRIAFVEGGAVQVGDVLYAIDDRPFVAALQQAEALLVQARADAIRARSTFDRYSRLYAEGAASQQDFETTQAAAQSSAALVGAREAAVRDAQVNLAFTVIRAPVTGVMNRSLVKPGALVLAGQTLLTTLYAGDVLYIYFAVDQDAAAYLAAERYEARQTGKGGLPERTYEIVLGDGSVLASRGRLDFVAPAIDDTTGTLQARLDIPRVGTRVRPGQFVRVRVPIVERKDGIRVPQRAVSELQGMKSVFVVRGGKAKMRRIEARHRVDGDWLVDRGLSPGEMIVVEGTSKVRDGAAVRTVPYVPPHRA